MSNLARIPVLFLYNGSKIVEKFEFLADSCLLIFSHCLRKTISFLKRKYKNTQKCVKLTLFFSSFRLSFAFSFWRIFYLDSFSFLFSYTGYLRNYSYQKNNLNYKNVSLFECCVFISYGSMKIQHFLPALILCHHRLIFPFFFSSSLSSHPM